jgi:L-lactate utilization protein LutB
MADFQKLSKTLEGLGYRVHCCATAAEAADYLDSRIDGKSVGFGGSVTVQEMGLYPKLAAHNQAIWHWEHGKVTDAANTDVYISSVNGLAETGEIINIDGNCNRVASTIYGHKQVYLIVGANKIAPDYDAALWRARNIAAPKNAQRLGRKTPCAAKGDKCYNCNSPERICNALVVLWRKPTSIEHMEIVLVEQELGY